VPQLWFVAALTERQAITTFVGGREDGRRQRTALRDLDQQRCQVGEGVGNHVDDAAIGLQLAANREHT
jgi:hypothetical protein